MQKETDMHTHTAAAATPTPTPMHANNSGSNKCYLAYAANTLTHLMWAVVVMCVSVKLDMLFKAYVRVCVCFHKNVIKTTVWCIMLFKFFLAFFFFFNNYFLVLLPFLLFLSLLTSSFPYNCSPGSLFARQIFAINTNFRKKIKNAGILMSFVCYPKAFWNNKWLTN